MSRAQNKADSVNESIETTRESKEDNWMRGYLNGDIEFVGGNGKFRRTEDANTTQTKVKATTKDDIVKELEDDSDFFNEMMNAFEQKGEI